MKNSKLSLKTMLDQDLTPCDEPSERILEVAIKASEAGASYQRPPLNLALVIDRSGSMGGEKVEYAKQAASHVVGLLNAKDRVALVQYDDRIDVLFHSTKVDDESQQVLQRRIAGIHARGSTNLCDGWLTGCQEIAGGVGSEVFTHAMLMSDGLANVGTTHPLSIANHSMELARRGITTSTFGIGIDYDQHLLEDMANLGEGMFRFIESPQDIPRIFEDVFKELLAIAAHDVEVVVSFPPELNTAVLGDYRTEHPEAGKLRIFLGSLSAGKDRDLFIKLSVPPSKAGTELPIKVNLRLKDEKGLPVEMETGALVKVVSKEEAAGATKDEELLKRFAQVEIGDRASAALKLEKEGKRHEASELLQTILKKHENRTDTETQDRFQDMSVRMAAGMDERDRKWSHYETYMQKKQNIRGQTYRLKDNVKGHLIFDKDGDLVLLDTGSHVSFGRQSVWDFMNRQLRLPPNFMKFSPAYLSRMIGVPIEVVLGMDVLKELYFQIDRQRKLVYFSELPLRDGRLKIHLDTFMDVPFTHIKMNGISQKVFVDTGAKIHFVRKHIVAGLEPVDTEMDFLPYIGEFETEVFEIPIEIAGETHIMRCGVMPPLLDTALANTGGIEGLLGTEIFNKYIATFDMRNMLLSLQPYE